MSSSIVPSVKLDYLNTDIHRRDGSVEGRIIGPIRRMEQLGKDYHFVFCDHGYVKGDLPVKLAQGHLTEVKVLLAGGEEQDLELARSYFDGVLNLVALVTNTSRDELYGRVVPHTDFGDHRIEALGLAKVVAGSA